MFSSYVKLKKKTPEGGIDRPKFIKHLVEEYYTTTNIEAQEQVTANLANFGYDPINWRYLREADALQLFMEVLSLSNNKLALHGVAGLSNICLDTVSKLFLLNECNCDLLTRILLKKDDDEVILQTLALVYQLLMNSAAEEKKRILTPKVLKHLYDLKNTSQDKRLLNIIQLIILDFGTRKIEYDLNTLNLKRNNDVDVDQTLCETATSKKFKRIDDN